jgi:DNA-binding response OmpR family regulator
MKILLVEDDAGVAELLKQAFEAQHYRTELATSGQMGWDLAEAFEYDLIVLDVMLPDLDGIRFCQQLRAKRDRTPVLLLTAQDTGSTRVAGLDAGADDYVAKPFDLPELLARMRALLRRGSEMSAPIMQWEGLQFDPSTCEVSYHNRPLHLTLKEYELLELFLRHPFRIFSQAALVNQLWSLEKIPTENAVRAHIKGLRRKLKQVGAEDLIETIYGLGYRLRVRETASQSKPERCQAGIEPDTEPAARIPDPTAVPTLEALWERHRDKYLDRIATLEQAIAATRLGTLSEDLRQQAQRQAHTLVGSLGSFGFMAASQLARQIEHGLAAMPSHAPGTIEPLDQQIAALRQAITQTPTATAPIAPAPVSGPQLLPAKLLIIDDDVELAAQLQAEAAHWGMQVKCAADRTAARAAIEQFAPDAVLLDLCLPDSSETGLQLLAELTNRQPPIPVLVFTAAETFATRLRVAQLGGRGFLQKPIAPATLMAAIGQLLQQSAKPEAKLLIVDDDPQILDLLRSILEPWGFQLTLLADARQFWQTLRSVHPDLLILDVEMPYLSGIELCQVVRNDPHFSELPILFLSVLTDAATIQRVFMAGADDYIAKPIVGPELVARVLNRLERVQMLKRLAAAECHLTSVR